MIKRMELGSKPAMSSNIFWFILNMFSCTIPLTLVRSDGWATLPCPGTGPAALHRRLPLDEGAPRAGDAAPLRQGGSGNDGSGSGGHGGDGGCGRGGGHSPGGRWSWGRGRRTGRWPGAATEQQLLIAE